MYLVYLLKSDKYSYVGMTNDFTKRFRQHNKEIKGGARYTSRRQGWYPVLIIDGFTDMKSAMQCEWRLKHFAIGHGSVRGVKGKLKYLSKYLYQENIIKYTQEIPIFEKRKWTTKCEKSIYDQNLTFYLDDDFVEYFNEYPHKYNHKELYWK
jgi:predicted GIY-YIG superfamily endonuclease